MRPSRISVVVLALDLLIGAAALRAHEGPPFPLVSDRIVGVYRLAVWTDPDSTDDGAAGGRFWVTIEQAQAGADIPAGTHIDVAIEPANRSGVRLAARAEPVNGDVGNQLAALVMDHEGRFRVHVGVDGPLGRAEVDAEVDATYDLRPPPILIAVYVLPFLLIGFIWVKLLIRRRHR